MRLFFATLILATPLAAQCTFSVAPTTFNVPSTPSTLNMVTVTISPSNCNQGWVASAAVSWLHITAATLNGSGTATFSVDANPFGVNRIGSLNIANTQVNVTQTAAACKFGLSPSSQNFAVGGGSGAFLVQANCAWTANNNSPQFIAFPNTGGTTDATVTFTVAANGCLGGRTGSISMSGSGLATPLLTVITQDGSANNFSLSGTGATADSTASDGRFTVTTGLGCGWSASSDVSWMSVTSGASGAGNGAIAYHLLANTSSTRTGNIKVSAAPGTQLTYAVTQQAAGAPTPEIASVNNAANYATGAVSPGEIVTLFGKNLGPSPIAKLQIVDGALTTTLGGTQVLFDGVAAPMIYSFQGQVSAVAPYGIAGKTSTQVQLKYNGAPSATMEIPVQASTPAIFTLDASGLGPGAILNQDFSINGAGRPAARGSVVAIYCTGGGVTDPPTVDGSVIGSTLPRLTLPVAVNIGGVDAKVQYAGGVPSSVAGLIQINAEVPASVRPGSGIPVTITVGGVSSGNGVTMTVN